MSVAANTGPPTHVVVTQGGEQAEVDGGAFMLARSDVEELPHLVEEGLLPRVPERVASPASCASSSRSCRWRGVSTGVSTITRTCCVAARRPRPRRAGSPCRAGGTAFPDCVPGGHAHLHLAVERRHLDLRAERRLREATPAPRTRTSCACAPEERVRLHAHDARAGRPARRRARPGSPCPGDAPHRRRLGAGRDAHRELALLSTEPAALAAWRTRRRRSCRRRRSSGRCAAARRTPAAPRSSPLPPQLPHGCRPASPPLAPVPPQRVAVDRRVGKWIVFSRRAPPPRTSARACSAGRGPAPAALARRGDRRTARRAAR